MNKSSKAAQKPVKKRYLTGRIKFQATFLLLIVFFIPVVLGFSYFVDRAIDETEENSMILAEKTTQQITADLYSFHTILLNTSEYFSNEEWILEILDREYIDDSKLKKANMSKIKNRFMEADSLDSGIIIGAIYTNTGQFFNFYTGDRKRNDFYDPFPEDRIHQLEALGINDPSHFAKLVWTPMKENILLPEKAGDPRMDMVVIGSRRTFHRYLGRYLNTHIFIIPEKRIYEKYSPYLRDHQTVWILDASGNLVSSSDLDYLQGKALPEIVAQNVLNGGETCFSYRIDGVKQLVSYTKDSENGWYTVMEFPAISASQYIWDLFRRFIVVFFLFVILFIIGIILFSNQISKPLEKMIASMKYVTKGEFVPAPESLKKNEIGEITRYYNAMVDQLRELIEMEYERDKRSRELESKVLIGQINPHFVYNTLETIVWKANQAKLPEIGMIASQLGKLLRSSVKNEEFIVTVAQELEQTMIYMDIQKIRYKEKLTVEILPFPEMIKSYRVLRMVLQPMIENAIVHGMIGKNHVLRITVALETKDDSLCIYIRDNGAGMSKERLEAVRSHIYDSSGGEKEISTTGSGIGIKNIQERMRLYFGPEYGLQIDSTQGEGTIITMRMPLITQDETFSF